MTSQTITLTKRDGTTIVFVTPFTDAEVRDKLVASRWSASPIGGDFGASLCDSIQRWGTLTDRQMDWAHKLVVEASTPSPRDKGGDRHLPRVRSLVDAAYNAGLRFPKINLTTADGKRVRLSRAGDRSRAPGVVHVTDGRPYDNNTYYGKLYTDGVFVQTRSATPDIIEFLETLDADPEATASAYGSRTGNCCFCTRPLTDGRSVAVGYGPTCAENFGLAWGGERVESTVAVMAK